MFIKKMLGSKGILPPLIPDCSVLRTPAILKNIIFKKEAVHDSNEFCAALIIIKNWLLKVWQIKKRKSCKIDRTEYPDSKRKEKAVQCRILNI